MSLFFRAIAASAPVAWFGDLTPCDAYSKVVTHDFTRENENCPRNVRKSWDIITRKGKTGTQPLILVSKIQQIFHT